MEYVGYDFDHHYRCGSFIIALWTLWTVLETNVVPLVGFLDFSCCCSYTANLCLNHISSVVFG